jgi:hypothetical protein
MSLEDYIESLKLKFKWEKEFDFPSNFLEYKEEVAEIQNTPDSYDKPKYRALFLKMTKMSEDELITLFIERQF